LMEGSILSGPEGDGDAGKAGKELAKLLIDQHRAGL